MFRVTLRNRLWPSQTLSGPIKTGSNRQETQRLLLLPAHRDQDAASLEVELIGRDQRRQRKSTARVAADRLRLLSRSESMRIAVSAGKQREVALFFV